MHAAVLAGWPFGPRAAFAAYAVSVVGVWAVRKIQPLRERGALRASEGGQFVDFWIGVGALPSFLGWNGLAQAIGLAWLAGCALISPEDVSGDLDAAP